MDRKLLVATLVAIAIVGTGCGGGGSLTRAELVTRADAVCTQLRTEGQAAFQRARANHGATLKPDLSRLGHRAVGALAQLRPPGAVSGTYHRYVAALRSEMEAMTSSASQTPAGQRRQERATHLATNLRARLGLHAC
jgi:hypothetical protein